MVINSEAQVESNAYSRVNGFLLSSFFYRAMLRKRGIAIASCPSVRLRL